MPGMYPNDRMVEVFGEEIKYPGLDPVTQKFTDGDFLDPLKKPSYIPAETTNLILDNLENLIRHAGLSPNNTDTDQLVKAVLKATQDREFPIGERYMQYPNDLNPMEAGLPGVWELWNHRAEQYGLISQPLPPYTVYTPAANYAANEYVMCHLPGDDYTLSKAIAAVSNAAQQLDPVLWDKFQPGIFVPRRFLQEWTDSDFSIGDTVAGGAYDGYKVAEINVLGGKFPSFAGGNRPPFVSGGVAADVMREIQGQVSGGFLLWNSMSKSGVFNNSTFINGYSPGNNMGSRGDIKFNLGNVVLVGPENSPRTLSVLCWRRVA